MFILSGMEKLMVLTFSSSRQSILNLP